MNDRQTKEQYSAVRDEEIRLALDQHWAASDTNDFETEHGIYREDALLEYPQSGERTRGRRNIQNQRASQPSKKRFAVRRIIGGGDLLGGGQVRRQIQVGKSMRNSFRSLCGIAVVLLVSLSAAAQSAGPAKRPRAAEIGLKVGVLLAGPLDAITDVAGVQVGQATIIRGDNVRTGVTAILPHAGNLYRERVPGGVFTGNGYGKLTGSTQLDEMGEIETPILLTSTTSVPRVADALISYMLSLAGNENVLSINPIVGETNDGYLNDIRGRHIAPEDVANAIRDARSGPVEEGTVGAGTGTVAFGWKGGIGTASRRLPASLGEYTVGVLVQSNFGGILTINGAPVGQELGQYYLRNETGEVKSAKNMADGSCMMVIATDAPLDARNLKRLAARAWVGMGRTGSSASNGSGDYAIAFSTSSQVRIHISDASATRKTELLTNEAMSPLFEAVIEATEEAIYNSMLKATTVTGNGHTVEALPIDKLNTILKQHKLTR